MLSERDYLASLVALWNVAQGDTGQAGVCARLLLGLYNGARFPFDLTDLRRLDTPLLRAAFDVLARDAACTGPEVHEVLNSACGRRDFGPRLEHMAHFWRLRGRCAREGLSCLGASPLLVQLPGQPVLGARAAVGPAVGAGR